MHGIHFLTIHISLQQIHVECLLCVLHILEDVKKNKSYDVHKELTVFFGREDMYFLKMVMIKDKELIITDI